MLKKNKTKLTNKKKFLEKDFGQFGITNPNDMEAVAEFMEYFVFLGAQGKYAFSDWEAVFNNAIKQIKFQAIEDYLEKENTELFKEEFAKIDNFENEFYGWGQEDFQAAALDLAEQNPNLYFPNETTPLPRDEPATILHSLPETWPDCTVLPPSAGY